MTEMKDQELKATSRVLGDGVPIVDPTRFSLPDMGDFDQIAIDDEWLRKLSGDINSVPRKEAFYVDPPPYGASEFGKKDADGVIWTKTKVRIDNEMIRNGRISGDRFSASLADLQAGNDVAWKDAFQAKYGQASRSLAGSSGRSDEEFTVEMVGLECPSPQRWATDYVKTSTMDTKTATVGELKSAGDSSVWSRYSGRTDSEIVKLMNIGGEWREYQQLATADDVTQVSWIMADSQSQKAYDDAKLAQSRFSEIVNKAGGNVYLMIDNNSLNKSSTQFTSTYGGDIYGSGPVNAMKLWQEKALTYNEYKSTGFSQIGQDRYGRAVAAAWVQVDGKWINVAKYVMSGDISSIGYSNNTNLPSKFNIEGYDYNNVKYADMSWDMAQKLDDREKIQRSIFGKSMLDLKEWTVCLGDVMLFVPPTSIRCITQTQSERMPVVRSRGTMAKSSGKSQRMIELSLFFSGDRGINGQAYEDDLPGGKKKTYYMNGLRALISQFKFAPYLPIDNRYINEVLNVEAVNLLSFSVQTVPEFPKLMQATLLLQEFNYRAFMPELPVYLPEENSYFRNAFGATINWSVFRYYYQRAIEHGNNVAKLTYNSPEYNKETIGNKTALMPMTFADSKIEFYIADENHLKQKLAVKLAMKRTGNIPIMSSEDKTVAKELGKVYDVLNAIIDRTSTYDHSVAMATAIVKANEAATPGNIPYTEAYAVAEALKAGMIQGGGSGSGLTADGSPVLQAPCIASVSTIPAVTVETEDGFIIRTGVEIKLNASVDRSALSAMLANAGSKSGISADNLMVNNTLKFYIDGSFVNETTGSGSTDYDKSVTVSKLAKGFAINKSIGDVPLLSYCKDFQQTGDVNATATALKDATDLETADSLKFIQYEIGDVNIQSITASYGNTFANIGVTGMESHSPQYMGGQDIQVMVSMTTMSEQAVAMINSLPRLSAYYARTYRMVMPCWPLKVKSEITGMLGVQEVILDQVDVNTVPGHPGLYTIQLRMVSVDRTLRNKESMKRIAMENAGSIASQARSQINLRSYFDFAAVLAKAELYPDLELPTLEELKKHQFNFVRYKLDDGRVYPDPDFYFCYFHTLTSQVMREMITNAVADKFGTYTFKDRTGAGKNLSPKANVAYTTSDCSDVGANKIYKQQQEEQQKKALQAQQSEIKKQESSPQERLKNYANVAANSDAHKSWDVAPTIKAIFLEPKYRETIRAAGIKNGSASTAGSWAGKIVQRSKSAIAMIDAHLAEPIPAGLTPVANTYKVLYQILGLLGADANNEKMKTTINHIVNAAGCAATGNKEYSEGAAENQWSQNPGYFGTCFGGGQDKAATRLAATVEDAVENGFEFGRFKFKMFEPGDLYSRIREPIKTRNDHTPGNINTTLVVLDPYYRYAPIEVLAAYKRSCITNYNFAVAAYLRNTMLWLKFLIKQDALPSISTDMLREAMRTEIIVQKSVNTVAEDNDAGTTLPKTADGKSIDLEQDLMKKHMEYLDANSHALDAGKFFAAAMMANTNGDQGLFDLIEKRDYKALNSLISGVISAKKLSPEDKTGMSIRKNMLALVGIGVLKTKDIGTAPEHPSVKYHQAMMEKIYIEAADDPAKYIPHSFYDMAMSDYRGRMLRAFPTFYLLFVDEGREIGMWKLHDNFYNTSSIAEITIAKSRKIAADTCTIMMSNMYNTFTTEDEDLKADPQYKWQDVFESLFSPRTYFMKEEGKRLAAKPAERIRLRSGARIHVKLGYGSNANRLGTAFNGIVAEVGCGEMVEIIAQGDGIELSQPILENDEAAEVQNKDKAISWLSNLTMNGATPKTILNSILTTKGGWLKTVMKSIAEKFDWSFLNSRNPFGMVHFGDPDYVDIFRAGEPTQNIYEALSKPVWATDTAITGAYSMNDSPRITFQCFGKTFWDILHICGAVSPDFIVGVAPFDLRSTIFHGAPRYYYAWTYEKKNDIIYEKRKPFQQYHLYSSLIDIVGNSMRTSDRGVRTCGIGIYQYDAWLQKKETKRTDPLWVDIEIFPENQKTMTVDTQLWGKGVPILGYIPGVNWIANTFGGDKGMMQSADRIAWRATASALKKSVYEMYQGELVVYGDPSVKPNDRMFVNDGFENIAGQCLVREVVHHFSARSGFVTGITPDCIAAVDDRHEMVAQTFGALIASRSSIVSTLLIYGGASTWAKSAQPIMKYSNGSMTKAIGKANEYVNKLAGLGSKGEKAAKGITAAAKAVNSRFLTGAAKVGSAAAKVAAGLGAGAATVAAAPAILAAAVEMAIVYTLTSYVSTMIERWMKNLQVLQIFPLKKYGVVWTAGVDGSRGLVYGSPTYNDPGWIKSSLGKLFGTKDSALAQLLTDMLATDEMKAIASRWEARNQNVPLGDAASQQKAIGEVMGVVSASQNKNMDRSVKQLLTPVVTVKNTTTQEIDQVLQTSKIPLPANLDYGGIATRIVQENRYLKRDGGLKKFFDAKILVVLHDQDTAKADQAREVTLQIGGEDVRVKAILSKDAKNNPVHDLPFVKPEALAVIEGVMTQVQKLLKVEATQDRTANGPENCVVIASALRIGDKTSPASTGYCFSLRGSGSCQKILSPAVTNYEKELEKFAKDSGLKNNKLFYAEKAKNVEGVIGFLVFPIKNTPPAR